MAVTSCCDKRENAESESSAAAAKYFNGELSKSGRRRGVRRRQNKVPADKDDRTPSSSTESVERILPPVNRRSTKELEETSPVKQKVVTIGHPSEEPPAIVDVGQDPELEQLLDQSVVPLDLGEKFPSSESEEDAGFLQKRVSPKKRKLFSDTYLDSGAEESDMFGPSPVKKKSNSKNKHGLTVEMPSTEEFNEGLKEAAVELLSLIHI